MTTVHELAANLRPTSLRDLRRELRELRAGEALMLVVAGREFVLITGADWSNLIEDATDRDRPPLAPS